MKKFTIEVKAQDKEGRMIPGTLQTAKSAHIAIAFAKFLLDENPRAVITFIRTE